MFTLDIEMNGRSFQDAEAAFHHLDATLNKEVNEGMVRASRDLMRTLQKVSDEIKKKHSNPWNGRLVNDTKTLQRRSGNGLLSIAKSIRLLQSRSDIIAGSISTGTMGEHETGGIRRAKGGGYLTIPLPAAMDSRGVALKARARDWDNTFVARSKKGSLLIFQNRGTEVIPLYVLKKSVKIPARLGMEDTVMGALPYFEQKAFETLCAALDI